MKSLTISDELRHRLPRAESLRRPWLALIERNRKAGLHFFNDGALLAFDSRLLCVHTGPGGTYAIDSSQFHHSDANPPVHGPRVYKVRRWFDDGHCLTLRNPNPIRQPFWHDHDHTFEQARQYARALAEGWITYDDQ